jgi:hypothetical protein
MERYALAAKLPEPVCRFFEQDPVAEHPQNEDFLSISLSNEEVGLGSYVFDNVV